MIGMIVVRLESISIGVYAKLITAQYRVHYSGIRKCAAWYAAHVAQMHTSRPGARQRSSLPPPEVVLVTDDAANRRRAEAEGLRCMSVREYVEGMPNAEKLVDLLAVTDGNELEPTQAVAARAAAVYPEVSLLCLFVAMLSFPDLRLVLQC